MAGAGAHGAGLARIIRPEVVPAGPGPRGVGGFVNSPRHSVTDGAGTPREESTYSPDESRASTLRVRPSRQTFSVTASPGWRRSSAASMSSRLSTGSSLMAVMT